MQSEVFPSRAADRTVAAALAEVTLPNANGITTRLGTLWETSPAVVVLLPHWSWPACRAQAEALRDGEEAFRVAGARVAAVGPGDRGQARALRETLGLRYPLLVDEEGAAYQAAGLRRATLLDLARPSTLLAAVQAVAGGTLPGADGAVTLQLGGVFVFAPGNLDVLVRRGESFADVLPSGELLALFER